MRCIRIKVSQWLATAEKVLPQLKDDILNHDGFISIRGDSGDPVGVITETVYRLWGIFGGTVNSKGYKVLNPHVKAIYGDSITPQRCEQIYSLLEKNGFAINNVSLGVGSFSMECLETIESDGSKQYNPYTRDTFGIAVKATYAEDADGKPIMIFKNPKTDTGHFKKSQRGCCRVVKTGDGYDYVDGLTWAEAQDSNELRTVFRDGKFDLFQTHAKYICHQVNCQARMGSGVAKQVRAKYPEVYNAYVGFCNEERNAFGQTQFVQANDGKVVVNMFAQSNYGYDGKLYTDYTAFQSCLKRIKLTVPAGETIAMPFKIGCGLGGGDWNVILGLIQKELSDKYTVELWRKEV